VTPRIVLRVEGESVSLVVNGRYRPREEYEVRYEAHGLYEGIRGLLASVPKSRRHSAGILVELEPPVVQVRTLRGLPPLSARELRDTVATNARRFFRLNGTTVVTDAAWTANGIGAVPEAVAAAAPLLAVKSIISALQSVDGCAVLDVRVDHPQARFLSLLPPDELQARSRLAWRRLSRWGMAVGVLWVVAGGVAWGRTLRERSRVEAELARVSGPAASLVAVRREMGRAADLLASLEQAESARHVVGANLRIVAEALPDGAYLTSIELDRDSTVTLTGKARDAMAVPAALERGGLQRTTFEGPVAQAVLGTEGQAFTLHSSGHKNHDPS